MLLLLLLLQWRSLRFKKCSWLASEPKSCRPEINCRKSICVSRPLSMKQTAKIIHICSFAIYPLENVRMTSAIVWSKSSVHTGIWYFQLLYRWWNTRIFPFTKRSYLHCAQWRYYFYLSCVRILVAPWLLTWLANYKRASCF